MKTTIFRHPWRVLAGMSVLLLTVSPLAAMPTVKTISGGPSYGHVNGSTSLAARFHTPVGLAMDPSGGFLYVADFGNNAIRVLDLGANNTFDFATVGITNPIGVAVDSDGNVYVLNRGNGRNGSVVRFDDYGNPYPLAAGVSGLTNANGIALDRLDNIYLTVSNKVVKITPAGVRTTLATITHKGASLQGIAVQDDHWLAVCDYTSNGIVRINLDTGVATNLTGFNGPGDHFGTKAYAKFNHPYGIAAAGGGLLIVSDYSNNRVKMVDSAGTVTNLYGVASSFWVTGAGTYPGWWDGVVARGDVNYNAKGYAESRLPAGVFFANDGSVYTTEDYYHLIRKVTSANLPPLPPPPPVAPAIWTVLTNYGQVTLTWSPVAGVTNYNVKRSTSDGGPYTTIASLTATTYTDTTVINGRTYYYVVSAAGAGGEGPDSAQVTATTPLPPPPDPQIGYVDFPASSAPVAYTSVFHPVSSFVMNNDTLIVIQGSAGSQTFYTFGATPGVGSIPDPTSASYSAPVGYQDGMNENQVAIYAIGQVTPDLTIKAVAEKNDGSPNSAIVQARFQFVAANPTINGDNAAQFTLSDATANAHLFYTIDGTDPSPTNGVDLGTVAAATNNWTAGFSVASNTVFKVRAFRDHYQPSSIVSAIFSPSNFVANVISFGFASGEASSDFMGAPGQTFYAPVTLSVLPDTKMYSLQFSISVTNGGPNPGPLVTPGAYSFQSFLEKPIPDVTPVVFEWIPPLMFSMYANDPPPANQIVTYDGQPAFVNMIFTNSSINLLGVGWLERAGATNLYDTLKQDLITYSQAHDTQFLSKNGHVIAGGYAFQIPPTATPGQTYRIQLDRPSATSDGVGAPGSDVYIATPTNGSLTVGALNSIKIVTVGQRKYVAGDSYPFEWFNAGDFGDFKLDNADVMQVFQSAIYGLNAPPPGSDFFDAMDSCGGTYIDNGHGYLEFNSYVSGAAAQNALFDGNDSTINQIGFGDSVLDVCDVYMTFRRSLDPSLNNFQRFWTNGVLGAQIVGNPPAPSLAMAMTKSLLVLNATNLPSVNFSCGDAVGSPGQVLQIPIRAQMFGTYPLRVLMLNLSVIPLDGSPALTSPIQFTPNPALGQPALTSAMGNGNYAASWLDSSIAGLAGSAILGTLTVTIPPNAPSSAAYAIHFDHASASPNGIATFPRQTMTGLITLSQRTNSVFGDAIPDSWRLRYFGTVNNILSQANADADGDGVINWQEYVAGTDPTDSKSRLNLSTGQAAAQPGQGCVVHWPSVAGKHYVIERSDSLFPGSWLGISTNTGSGTEMEFQDTTVGSVRFYRVQVVP